MLFSLSRTIVYACKPPCWLKKIHSISFSLNFSSHTLNAHSPANPQDLPFQLLIFIPSQPFCCALNITCFDWSIRCESLFSALAILLLLLLYDLRAAMREHFFQLTEDSLQVRKVKLILKFKTDDDLRHKPHTMRNKRPDKTHSNFYSGRCEKIWHQIDR